MTFCVHPTLAAFNKASVNFDVVEHLEHLLEVDRDFEKFAAGIRDPRLKPDLWRRILYSELYELKGWCYRQIMASGGIATSAPLGEVLVLLPGYAFALHVIRRAVIFAILGSRVTCSFGIENSSSAATVVDVISNALGLVGTLRADVRDGHKLLADVPRNYFRIVIVTGRRETVQTLRETFDETKVFGCTGRCAIEVLPVDGASIIESEFSSSGRSCTSVRASFVYTSGRWCGVTRDWEPEEVLLRLHPSVVLDRTGILPTIIKGYCCINTTRPTSLKGFASDPIFGWPGDYTLGITS